MVDEGDLYGLTDMWSYKALRGPLVVLHYLGLYYGVIE